MVKLGHVDNLQDARIRLAQLEGGDGKWTMEKVYSLMAGAGFAGTVAEARTHVANKHRRQ